MALSRDDARSIFLPFYDFSELMQNHSSNLSVPKCNDEFRTAAELMAK